MQESTSFVAHKFKPLDKYGWEILETSTLYFPDCAKLNDPADCQIDLMSAFRLARVGLANNDEADAEKAFRIHAQAIMEHARTCGIFSLCSGSINSDAGRLMWAHYAANHTGVCLTFEIPHAFAEQLVGMAPVEYSTDELFKALQQLKPIQPQGPDGEFFDTFLKPVITSFLVTKSPEWKYEQESRLVSSQPGHVAFDPSWLKQICFGLRTSTPDRERVAALVKKFPSCNLVEVVRAKDDLFRVDLREL
ncbi:DUF2971 domain-containing protein [Paraburkholderia sp. RL17-368-BIF-A]|jgi:hypothetical protein|uniref:DUF2971 domain-containing protein n=1 Tax=Paraburkholderia sp. RL17-368-BIF-A TaxID=3031628 RepID=UPI0006B3F51B|nr:hypothetical protein AC233_04080 [Burkholderia sp. HB1]